ncbi:MAG: rhomboid family intramembrane serine protease [Pseudobdellovibrionaceae bacterium]
MIVFSFVSFLYIASLLFIQPAPKSLKGSKLSFAKNFLAIRGSLFVGLFLILIFLVTSNFKFLKISDGALVLLGLSNLKELSILWPLQFFTHVIIHLDITHLVANLSGLALASLYERRVGTKRFLAVLAVSALFSGFSILFYRDASVACGISGGVFGLAVSYFIDSEEIQSKDLVQALLAFSMLFILYSFFGSSKLEFSGKVDQVGHVLGAIAGALYCRKVRKPVRRN